MAFNGSLRQSAPIGTNVPPFFHKKIFSKAFKFAIIRTLGGSWGQVLYLLARPIHPRV
jgi:hypothetical protein